MDLNKDSASVQSGLGAKKVRLQALDNPQRVRQGGLRWWSCSVPTSA